MHREVKESESQGNFLKAHPASVPTDEPPGHCRCLWLVFAPQQVV